MDSHGGQTTFARAAFAAVILTAIGSWAARESIVDASDWMFRRSYYSHDVEPADRDDWSSSRSAYREPWVGAHPHTAGFGVADQQLRDPQRKQHR
jgi:hypothetical protein